MCCDLWPYVLWPLDFQSQKRIFSAETIWGNRVTWKIFWISGQSWILFRMPNMKSKSWKYSTSSCITDRATARPSNRRTRITIFALGISIMKYYQILHRRLLYFCLEIQRCFNSVQPFVTNFTKYFRKRNLFYRSRGHNLKSMYVFNAWNSAYRSGHINVLPHFYWGDKGLGFNFRFDLHQK